MTVSVIERQKDTKPSCSRWSDMEIVKAESKCIYQSKRHHNDSYTLRTLGIKVKRLQINYKGGTQPIWVKENIFQLYYLTVLLKTVKEMIYSAQIDWTEILSLVPIKTNLNLKVFPLINNRWQRVKYGIPDEYEKWLIVCSGRHKKMWQPSLRIYRFIVFYGELSSETTTSKSLNSV